MQCTGCKYPDSAVVDTRKNEDKNIITRRRACLRCGLRFTTNEQLKEPRRIKDDRTGVINK